MSPDTQLLPLDAEELLHEIRCGYQRDLYGNSSTEAVRFYPVRSGSNGHNQTSQIPSEENFWEGDYLRSNPDAAAAVERGDFRSGYEHWIACGKLEGRSFEPLEFDEAEYLQLNPDVVDALRDGTFASGREHWLKCGRLEGRKVKMLLPLFTSRLIDLDIQSRSAISGIGEIPPTPATARGRLGRWLISAIRRLLWWYTGPLKRFAQIIDQRFRAYTSMVEHLGTRQEEQKATLQSLRDDVRAIREQVSGIVSQNISERVEHLTTKLMDVQAGIGALDNRLDATRQPLHQSWSTADPSRVLSDCEVARLGNRITQLEQRLAESNAALNSGLAAEMSAREDLDGKLSDLRTDHRQLQSHGAAVQQYAEQMRTELAFHVSRVSMLLTEARRRLPGPFQAEQLDRIADAAQHDMDALYMAFENAFRGSREDVKHRQSIYLAYLTNAGAGTNRYPVLDLGCGRGEWLELLRDRGLIARGVDRNRLMIELCTGIGLEVIEANVLTYARDLPDGAFGAITAFHLVEHIPFDNLIALLDQALRLLKPGGLLILETPNPANIAVASQNFYLDPTHLSPLPSPMLRFFVEARGFCNSQVLPLHPCQVPLTSSTDMLSQRLNELFTGPQDYAIIAERPQGQAALT
jgi:O-antigen chain-terminating methyltransferase